MAPILSSLVFCVFVVPGVWLTIWILAMAWYQNVFNTLRPGQDGRHFADDSFTCIFFNENCCILNKFSLKYVRKGPIDNNRALVQIMAWRRSGDKPLSEPMMGKFGAHICVSWPQWVKCVTVFQNSFPRGVKKSPVKSDFRVCVVAVRMTQSDIINWCTCDLQVCTYSTLILAIDSQELKHCYILSVPYKVLSHQAEGSEYNETYRWIQENFLRM